MRERLWLAWRATRHLLRSAGLALASFLFLPLLAFTVTVTVLVIGAGVLPETVLLLRRLRRSQTARGRELDGEEVPEAYVPLVGDLPVRVRTAVKDPGTYRDLRWLAAHLLYGWLLAYASLIVWIFGILVDGVWCWVLGHRAVVLPLLRPARRLGRRLVPLPAGPLARRPAQRRTRGPCRGVDGYPGGCHGGPRRRTAADRTRLARRYAGPPGGAVDAGGAGAQGVRQQSRHSPQAARRCAGPGGGGPHRTAARGARHPSADPDRPRARRCGTGARHAAAVWRSR